MAGEDKPPHYRDLTHGEVMTDKADNIAMAIAALVLSFLWGGITWEKLCVLSSRCYVCEPPGPTWIQRLQESRYNEANEN